MFKLFSINQSGNREFQSEVPTLHEALDERKRIKLKNIVRKDILWIKQAVLTDYANQHNGKNMPIAAIRKLDPKDVSFISDRGVRIYRLVKQP